MGHDADLGLFDGNELTFEERVLGHDFSYIGL
jgi:hypothetical protein